MTCHCQPGQTDRCNRSFKRTQSLCKTMGWSKLLPAGEQKWPGALSYAQSSLRMAVVSLRIKVQGKTQQSWLG